SPSWRLSVKRAARAQTALLLGLMLLGATLLRLSVLTAAGAASSVASGGRVEWIDVHTHLVVGRSGGRDYDGAVEAALAAMEEAGIRKMVLMPPPQVSGMPGNHDYDHFVEIVKRYPARLAFLGGGGSLNPMLQEAGQSREVAHGLRRAFEEKANEILRYGAAGFGEITAHHLSHMPGHPYESAPADHPLLFLLADIAARGDAVIDFHFDVVAEEMKAPEWLLSPPNPQLFSANLAAFEHLLAHNRKAKIVWAHAGSDMLGFWTTDLSRRLLTKYPNLYMSLRMAPGRTPQNHPMERGGRIRPEWMRLLQDYPDRFVIGGDQFFTSPSLRGQGPGITFSQRAPIVRERTRAFLTTLPPELYRTIAVENATRLYKLKD
ncbi:MAG: amidohydrolase family protein, partial [Deltaproteobacteria bacterium]|nr:amidohydrolase family protein [Deltaproteobacteria bacterium]